MVAYTNIIFRHQFFQSVQTKPTLPHYVLCPCNGSTRRAHFTLLTRSAAFSPALSPSPRTLLCRCPDSILILRSNPIFDDVALARRSNQALLADAGETSPLFVYCPPNGVYRAVVAKVLGRAGAGCGADLLICHVYQGGAYTTSGARGRMHASVLFFGLFLVGSFQLRCEPQLTLPLHADMCSTVMCGPVCIN